MSPKRPPSRRQLEHAVSRGRLDTTLYWGRERDRFPESPVLVFIPGLGNTYEIWDYVTSKLKEQFDCVAAEPPGYGHRPPQSCRVSLADSAESLGRRLKSYHRPVVLVGHSAGGLIAVEAATQCRQNGLEVAGIVLVNGLFDDQELVTRGSVLQGFRKRPLYAARLWQLVISLRMWLPLWFLHQAEDSESLICRRGLPPLVLQPRHLTHRQLSLLMTRGRARGSWRLFMANRGYPFASKADDLDCPVLVLESEHDPICTPSRRSHFVRKLIARGRRPRHATIHGGHCGPLEDPHEVARQIRQFVTADVAQRLKRIHDADTSRATAPDSLEIHPDHE